MPVHGLLRDPHFFGRKFLRVTEANKQESFFVSGGDSLR